MTPLAVDAPWWGAPLIAAVALLVGSGLTLAGSEWRAARDARRADSARWDEEVLDTCVAVERLCEEIAEVSRVGWPRYVADHDERLSRYLVLVDEVRAARARFRFVASDALNDAALALAGAAVREFVQADGIAGFEAARRAFVDTARRELRANRP